MKKSHIRALDREFSKRIRARGRCDRCGKRTNLQTSHIYSRRYLSVRWHPINANCFCAGCHWWFGLNPIEGQEWVRAYLGANLYARLKVLKQRLGKDLTPERVRAEWKAHGL